MAGRKSDILEAAARTLAEQAEKANALVGEALAAGLDGSHPLTVQADASPELLREDGRERELRTLVLDCSVQP
jgi:hypothetical protein